MSDSEHEHSCGTDGVVIGQLLVGQPVQAAIWYVPNFHVLAALGKVSFKPKEYLKWIQWFNILFLQEITAWKAKKQAPRQHDYLYTMADPADEVFILSKLIME